MRFSRFTIRSMLVATALCAIGLWVLMYPGHRAKKLARLIRTGDSTQAMAMLSQMPDDAFDYKSAVESVSALANSRWIDGRDVRRITIENPTISQLLTFQRSIVIGKGWGGGDCELIVSLTSVRPGRNWFHEW